MACPAWSEKLDAYVDGELSPADEREFGEHLKGCSACAAESLSTLQEKRRVQAAAAQRFVPDAAFRSRVRQSIAQRPSLWGRVWAPAVALAIVLVIAATIFFTLNWRRGAEQQLLGELADLHVATLASSNPVDVVSTDRHTVKPWFAGKIPFTFNVPELQTSAFTLVGGKVSYLHQAPGAELIFRVRQHQISVFIFQERDLGMAPMQSMQGAQSFNVRSWSRDGLVYFAISDVNGQDLDQLCELFKSAR
jgi:anti-sigma factor RsiW